MKKYLAAVALAAAVAQPAPAITFPSLTTIYVGPGVIDDGGANNVGIATAFICSNVSGVPASVRFLVLSAVGAVVGNFTNLIPHGATRTAVTHINVTAPGDFNLATSAVTEGVVNIESTQSGVFCNAMITDADAGGNGIALSLVRVNPHPGTVE